MATTFDADGIKESAKKLGALMDDMSAFEALKPHWPDAGNFDLGQWLERIVDDRRNAIVAHAEHLKLAMEDMEVTLTKIATDFENADGDNAAKINTCIGDMQGKISTDIAKLDENTEKEQGNFTSENQQHDGDGYNDNVNTPI